MTLEVDEPQRAVEFLAGVEAGTVDLRFHPRPKDGFLISVPYYSMAGRGSWSPREVRDWWDRISDLCTMPKPWFKKVGPLSSLGESLELLEMKSVLHAGTWIEAGTKWFDVNLHVPHGLDPDGKVDLATLHPTSTDSPASRWSLNRLVARNPDSLDVAISVGRKLHQAAIWELDALLPNGGRSWPVWY